MWQMRSSRSVVSRKVRGCRRRSRLRQNASRGRRHEDETELGEVVGHIGYNNRITLTVNFIPSGTSVANALLAASLPDVNGTCVISGAPVIEVGGYVDALNAPGSPGTGPGGRWIYAGGGSIKTTQTGKATGTITLKRYSGMGVTITGAATNL